MSQTIETGIPNPHHPELPKGYSDALTGLPNRRWLEREISTQITANPGDFSLYFVDLEDFKTDVNDLLGHAYGDEMLKQTGATLDENIRGVKHDEVPVERRSYPEHSLDQLGVGRTARIGGDEFVVIVAGSMDDGELESMKQRLQTALEERGIRASIGGKSHEFGETREELLKAADDQMYQDKSERKEARFKLLPRRKQAAFHVAGILYKYANHGRPR